MDIRLLKTAYENGRLFGASSRLRGHHPKAHINLDTPAFLTWQCSARQPVCQQLSPVQFRAILKHSLAASAAGRAAEIINLSMNTNSRTRASRIARRVNPRSGLEFTASKTRRACGCSNAAHTLAAVLSACADWPV
jgi:hypothetical protein